MVFAKTGTRSVGIPACVILFVVLCIMGCASMKARSKEWGKTIYDWWPCKKQWKTSALNAARHPGTWVPLVAAGVIAAGGWDRRISDWAREHTPVYGSKGSAEDASSYFRSATRAGMIITGLAVHDQDQYWIPMIKRMGWEYVGVLAATTARLPIAKLADRDRPNGDKEGFPSGHSTESFAYVGMTYRNVDELHLSPVWEYTAKSVETGCGIAVMWARVEAGYHFPTDVLAGAALGNFVSMFMHEAFLGKNECVSVQADANGGMMLSYHYNF